MPTNKQKKTKENNMVSFDNTSYEYNGKIWKLYCDGKLFKETDTRTPFVEWFVSHTIQRLLGS